MQQTAHTREIRANLLLSTPRPSSIQSKVALLFRENFVLLCLHRGYFPFEFQAFLIASNECLISNFFVDFEIASSNNSQITDFILF